MGDESSEVPVVEKPEAASEPQADSRLADGKDQAPAGQEGGEPAQAKQAEEAGGVFVTEFTCRFCKGGPPIVYREGRDAVDHLVIAHPSRAAAALACLPKSFIAKLMMKTDECPP
jgi:hypothetical protein